MERVFSKVDADGSTMSGRLYSPSDETMARLMFPPDEGWVEVTPQTRLGRWLRETVSMPRWRYLVEGGILSFLIGFALRVIR
jgi:hypothetical protein